MKNKKFNLFDLLIVVIIIGIAAALIFRNQIKDTLVNTQLKTFTVTVHCENVSNDAIDKSMTVGSEMQRPSSSKAFGVIKEVKKTPLSEEFIYIDRQVQMQSMQFSELDLILTVEGYESDGSYFSGDGSRLLENETVTLENALTKYTYTVTSVEIDGN